MLLLLIVIITLIIVLHVSLSCSELPLPPLLTLLFRSFALNNTTSTDTSALCDVTKSTHTPPSAGDRLWPQAVNRGAKRLFFLHVSAAPGTISVKQMKR